MRRFDASDLVMLNAWLAARGLPPRSMDDLGSTGFIIHNVACGFLLRTEARAFAMLDGFATNPTAPLRVRHAAIARLMARLLAEAKEHGISHVGGFTSSSGMGRLARRAGLEHAGATQVYRRAV